VEIDFVGGCAIQRPSLEHHYGASPDRPHHLSTEWIYGRSNYARQNGLTATPDELRNAYFGYYAYWGTYGINEADSTVEHNIQSSLRPEEVGALSFDRTKLVLSTPAYKAIPAFCGNLPAFCRDLPEDAQLREREELVNRLTWERVE
jgi:hypothetical protein